jgi:hypothetical protein
VTNALNWTSGASALNTVLASATGENQILGSQLAAEIAAQGAAYDHLYGSLPAYDTSKGAWLLAAGDAWMGLDHLLRYLQSLGPAGAGSSIAFNAYDDTLLLARVASVKAPAGALSTMLTSYSSAFTTAWAAPQPPYNQDVVQVVPVSAVTQAEADAQNRAFPVAAMYHPIKPSPARQETEVISVAIRPQEVALAALLAEVAGFVSLLAFT